MVSERSVLIVDRSEETREVLRTALGRQGVRILEASRARRGLELARQHHPDVIVLDAEVAKASPEEVCTPFEEESQSAGTRLVVLGNQKRRSRRPAHGEIIAKPYHYAPLIRKIEELLDATGRTYARSA